ncbi:UDP-N-acetylmuramoyl-L-alanyl-D-glutamate--2,6-diaminopimelate ligase [Candidatus Gracilibacteria bacterium]|nr:UDP-N-acetylmuramoyl-L-alanyl-D-glutamate--2,6-diaminopimelate ligase [Candidatus Gracilibacteria bacterium]
MKKYIALDNPFRLLYHKCRAILANVIYGFPSRDMLIVGVTGTNGKTTTCNIIAKGLKSAGKKVFMFSTVNVIIDDEEYTNDTKMTSPDAFELQRLLKVAKAKGCEIAVIETASHGIKMHRIWGIDYDISVLTNITQDHLDLHRTMKDYVQTKLKIFKNLITYRRKGTFKKTAVINSESNYADLFLDEVYDSLYSYGHGSENSLSYSGLKSDISGMSFDIVLPGENISVKTSLLGEFNVYNILAATGVFMSFGIEKTQIAQIISKVSGIPGRMESVENNEGINIFVDYAHTEDAIEKVLSYISDIKQTGRIITVFGATGDRDTTKRASMGEVVSRLSDMVILTQDDDYSEKTSDIIKDVLPGIERKEGENFWIIPERKEAIRTALLGAKKGDIVLLLGKGDEHVLMTNDGPVEWHDKTVTQEILKQIDENKVIE